MQSKAVFVFALMVLIGALTGFSLAQTTSPEDCNQILKDIQTINATRSQYANLTMYAFFSRLADKYHQLGECYQDMNKSGARWFKLSGDYYTKAANAYIVDFSKKYAYLVSAGDAYAAAGQKEKALETYKNARQILLAHPEIHIDTTTINAKISSLLNEKPISEKQIKNNVVWMVGLIVLLIVTVSVYYITRRY